MNPHERLMVHKNLNLARLPISPLSRLSLFILSHESRIVNPVFFNSAIKIVGLQYILNSVTQEMK